MARSLPNIIAAVVACIGSLVIVGWAIGSVELTSVWRGATAMNPLTAIGFVLGGVSLVALRAGGRISRLGCALAAVVAAIGLIRVFTIATGLDTHLDQALFSRELASQAVPNRMAPNTAVSFLLIGLTLTFAGSGSLRLRQTSQLLAFPVLVIAISVVLGYSYRAEEFTRVGAFIPMAFNTAFCFVLLAIGSLSLRTELGLIKLLTSSTMGGQMARRLATTIVIVLPLLGWLRVRGQELAIYGTAYGTALLVICSILALLCVVLFCTNAFHRLEEDGLLMRERLARTEERLETAVRGSNDGLWDWDRTTGELYVAPRFQELLGYQPHSDSMHFAKFTHFDELVHADNLDEVNAAFSNAVESGSPLDIDLRLCMLSGTYRWFRARGQVSRDTGGETVRVAGSITDVTDVKEAEARALHAQNEAQQASGAKSEFLSRMSHELRTPLNAVLGFAQLIELDAKSDDDRTNVEQILKAGKHLLSLIDEILDISRIEAGKLLVSVEPVRIGDVLDEVVHLMVPIASQKGIRLLASADDRWEEYVLVDRQRLKQVLLNLTSNAIKYNSENGAVTLTCVKTELGPIRILVADNGKGIDASMTARLFTPFDRLGAESGSIEGTGLGLALSKRLVELMGGVIGLDSEVGVGSKFFVEFACSEHPAAAVENELADAPIIDVGASKDAKTVLYIEDNQPNLDLIESIFRRRPQINLISAMQGRLGIDLAVQHSPDLILLDMNLPDLHGQQVLAELQADPRTEHIPVVIVSADAVSSRIERLIEQGAKAYLTKPISVSQFLAVVDDQLRAA